MPEQEPNNIDAALSEREIAFKEREIALKEQEAKAKIELDKRGAWFSSPLLIAVFSAIFGLLGTGIGAALQGYSNIQLERQKFESSLIQKALEAKDKDEAAKALLFLLDSGITQSLDGAKIRKIAENPEQLPQFSHYCVVIPATSKDLLTKVRQIFPGASYSSTLQGKNILAGCFDERGFAASRASLLQRSGFNAIVVGF